MVGRVLLPTCGPAHPVHSCVRGCPADMAGSARVKVRASPAWHCPVAQRVLAVPFTSIAPMSLSQSPEIGASLWSNRFWKVAVCLTCPRVAGPILRRCCTPPSGQEEGPGAGRPEVLLDLGAIACCCRLFLVSWWHCSWARREGEGSRQASTGGRGCTSRWPGECGATQGLHSGCSSSVTAEGPVEVGKGTLESRARLPT